MKSKNRIQNDKEILNFSFQKRCGIRVAKEKRQWKEGEFLAFDDSFEHEAWNKSSIVRVVLLLDIWYSDNDIPFFFIKRIDY